MHWRVAVVADLPREIILLRCRHCERVHRVGWHPLAASGTQLAAITLLEQELENALAAAYGVE